MKTKSQDLSALVERMPRLDKRGTLTGPRWPVAQEVYDTVLKGGEKSIVGLVDMLKEVDDGADWKVRYVLHGIATYLARPEKEEQRAHFSRTLAGQIGGDRPKEIQKFLIQELQAVGGPEVVETLGKVVSDPALCDEAAGALVAIREGAVEQFRKALPDAKGRPRLAALHALAALRDAKSVEAFRAAAGDEDRSVRLTGLQALAHLGDAGSVEILLKGADAKDAWERIQATDACFVLAENLIDSGRKSDARKIYEHLKKSRTGEKEQYLRDAAEEGLRAAR